MDTPSREITLTWKYLPPFSVGTIKGKNLLPKELAGSKFFPFRVAPISNGFKQQRENFPAFLIRLSKLLKGGLGSVYPNFD